MSEATNEKYDVFISFASQDKKTAREFATALDRQDVSHWNYMDYKLAGYLFDDLEEKIKNADCVAVIMSPASKNSDYVKREISIADANDKPFILIMVDGDKQSSIPGEIAGMVWIDARDSDKRELIFAEIAEGVKADVDDEVSQPVPIKDDELPRLMQEATVRGLAEYVEIAASLLDRRARACIYAIHPKDNSLYMIAATVASNNYDDNELKFSFKFGEGIIGTVAERSRSIIIKADHQKHKFYRDLFDDNKYSEDSILSDEVKLSKDKRDALQANKFVFAMPIINYESSNSELIGVLSIDHPDDLWDTRFTEKGSGEFDKFREEIIDKIIKHSASLMSQVVYGYKPYPLSFFTFHSLRYLLRIARRLPMFQQQNNSISRLDDLQVQSAIYYLHFSEENNDNDDGDILYMLASSRGYDYKELTRQFTTKEGIVGKVVREKMICSDNRIYKDDEDLRYYLRRTLGMSDEQIRGVIDIKSILVIPIFQPGKKPEKIIGVLSIKSSSTMDKSLLNHPSIIADAMRLANLAGKLIASEVYN